MPRMKKDPRNLVISVADDGRNFSVSVNGGEAQSFPIQTNAEAASAGRRMEERVYLSRINNINSQLETEELKRLQRSGTTEERLEKARKALKNAQENVAALEKEAETGVVARSKTAGKLAEDREKVCELLFREMHPPTDDDMDEDEDDDEEDLF